MNTKKINIKGAAKTGIQPTVTVAVEQNFPKNQRIVNDNLAPYLFTGINKFWIWICKFAFIRNGLVRFTEKLMKGGWSLFLVRKRYIDSKLIETIQEQHIKSVVNLGAGMDTRLFRFPEVQNIKSWEVDLLVNIKSKYKAITRALGYFPSHITQVPINFIEEDIEVKLKEKGYQSKEKTFFIWEAVSQYLDESSILKMFKFFSNAPSGSYLTFTYVLKDFVEGVNLYDQELLYKNTVKKNIWKSGFYAQEIASKLKEYGWVLIEDIDYDGLNDRYVKPTGRKLGVVKIERVVFAKKIN